MKKFKKPEVFKRSKNSMQETISLPPSPESAAIQHGESRRIAKVLEREEAAKSKVINKFPACIRDLLLNIPNTAFANLAGSLPDLHRFGQLIKTNYLISEDADKKELHPVISALALFPPSPFPSLTEIENTALNLKDYKYELTMLSPFLAQLPNPIFQKRQDIEELLEYSIRSIGSLIHSPFLVFEPLLDFLKSLPRKDIFNDMESIKFLIKYFSHSHEFQKVILSLSTLPPRILHSSSNIIELIQKAYTHKLSHRLIQEILSNLPSKLLETPQDVINFAQIIKLHPITQSRLEKLIVHASYTNSVTKTQFSNLLRQHERMTLY